MIGSKKQDPADSLLLVVDDDLTVRELLAEGLGIFGYPTVRAATAQEAIEIVRHEPVKLVLFWIHVSWKDSDWMCSGG